MHDNQLEHTIFEDVPTGQVKRELYHSSDCRTDHCEWLKTHTTITNIQRGDIITRASNSSEVLVTWSRPSTGRTAPAFWVEGVVYVTQHVYICGETQSKPEHQGCHYQLQVHLMQENEKGFK